WYCAAPGDRRPLTGPAGRKRMAWVGFSSLTDGSVQEAPRLLITARKSDQRPGAVARLGRKAEVAPLHADERGGDGQPKPCPSTFFFGGEERITQTCKMFRRNPHPFVAHLQPHTALDGVEGGGDGDSVPPVRERLQGVGQEIDHDLLYML